MKKIIVPMASALAFAVLALLPNACKHEPILPTDGGGDPIDTTGNNPTDSLDLTGWPCSPDTVYFAQQVLPILNSQCAIAGCHDAATHEDGINYSNYATTISTGKVKAGDPANSKLYKSLIDTDPDDRMPLDRPALSQAQKDLIFKWIQQGAKDTWCNESYGSCDTTGVTYANFIQPLMANKCQGCHTGTAAGGNIKITNYAETKAIGQNGTLYGSVAHLTGYSAMPKNGAKFTQCQIDKINAWVKSGMPQ